MAPPPPKGQSRIKALNCFLNVLVPQREDERTASVIHGIVRTRVLLFALWERASIARVLAQSDEKQAQRCTTEHSPDVPDQCKMHASRRLWGDSWCRHSHGASGKPTETKPLSRGFRARVPTARIWECGNLAPSFFSDPDLAVNCGLRWQRGQSTIPCLHPGSCRSSMVSLPTGRPAAGMGRVRFYKGIAECHWPS